MTQEVGKEELMMFDSTNNTTPIEFLKRRLGVQFNETKNQLDILNSGNCLVDIVLGKKQAKKVINVENWAWIADGDRYGVQLTTYVYETKLGTENRTIVTSFYIDEDNTYEIASVVPVLNNRKNCFDSIVYAVVNEVFTIQTLLVSYTICSNFGKGIGEKLSHETIANVRSARSAIERAFRWRMACIEEENSIGRINWTAPLRSQPWVDFGPDTVKARVLPDQLAEIIYLTSTATSLSELTKELVVHKHAYWNSTNMAQDSDSCNTDNNSIELLQQLKSYLCMTTV
jgi:hypothetical protein